MPTRRSKQRTQLYRPAGMLLDYAPITGDILALRDAYRAMQQGQTGAAVLTAATALPMIPPVARKARDWADVPLRSTKKFHSLPEKFLETHGYVRLADNEVPPLGKHSYRYSVDGKIEAFTPSSKSKKLQVKTFDDNTNLKTLRDWMGY